MSLHDRITWIIKRQHSNQPSLIVGARKMRKWGMIERVVATHRWILSWLGIHADSKGIISSDSGAKVFKHKWKQIC